MTAVLQVSTTTDSRDAAVDLAASAVRERLAACAQVSGPMTSVFWHLGEFGTGEEWQVSLKTTVDCYARLEAYLISRHPWKNPEVTAVELASGAADYLRWIRQSVAA